MDFQMIRGFSVSLCCCIAAAVLLVPEGEAQNVTENEIVRPYEFTFNIADFQHRSERKDDDGLITGEYGFITADGIYHETGYATDKTGDFIITKMKHRKISSLKDAEEIFGDKPEQAKILADALAKSCTDCGEPTELDRQESSSFVRAAVDAGSAASTTTTTTTTTAASSSSSTTTASTTTAASTSRAFTSSAKTTSDASDGRMTEARPMTEKRMDLAVAEMMRVLNEAAASDNAGGGVGEFSHRRRAESVGVHDDSIITTPLGNELVVRDMMVEAARRALSGEESSTEGGRTAGAEREEEEEEEVALERMANELFYRFNYTIARSHSHWEDGYRGGRKDGEYSIVAGAGERQGARVARVKYVSNEFGHQPNISLAAEVEVGGRTGEGQGEESRDAGVEVGQTTEASSVTPLREEGAGSTERATTRPGHYFNWFRK